MTSRLKIIAEETDNKVNMTELTTANDYIRDSKQLYKPSDSNDYKTNET